jgi:hypothetical protein
MSVRLLPIRRSLRGRFAFVFFDSQGEGCPVELHRRAWRPFIYRPPVLS